MPFAPVDQRGTHLYYEDSGPPSNTSVYTTVVAVHGAFFHCATFRPLYAFAAAHGLRIIAINRRDYPDSTPYSPEELSVINGSDVDAQALFMQARGHEIASFLLWICTEKNLPLIRLSEDGQRTGGLTLYGWSAGSSVILAFLAHLDKVAQGGCCILKGYLRTVILYDMPRLSMGYSTNLPARHNPFFQDVIPPWALTWLSAYYTHIPFHGDIHSLADYPDEDKVPTWDRLTSDERDSLMFPSATERDVCLFDPELVYKINYMRALFDPETARGILPDLSIKVVGAARSIWEVPTVLHIVSKQLEDYKSRGIKVRRIDVMTQEDVNHFAHWDMPEATMKFLASIA